MQRERGIAVVSNRERLVDGRTGIGGPERNASAVGHAGRTQQKRHFGGGGHYYHTTDFDVVDSLVGVVPVLGDLFDFGMKSNRRNVDLLERYLATPSKTKAASRGIVVLVILAAILLIVGLIAAGVWVARLLGRLVS